MKFQVHTKEKIYLTFMAVLGAFFYSGLFATLCIVPQYIPAVISYILIFCLFGYLASTFLIGHLKGNAIKVDEKQFPEIAAILKEHCETLGMNKVPETYILQGNGLLNAFATRVARKNVVVLFSDVLEVAYNEGIDAVSFIIGHELGHIKCNHVGKLKSWLLFPATMIPFLSSAYSRACEYTCDNIGYALCPQGATKGLLVLGAGKKLYKKVSVNQLLVNKDREFGFATWFAEVFSTHPLLVKRIAAIYERDAKRVSSNDEIVYMSPSVDTQKNEADYMPSNVDKQKEVQ